MTENTNSKLTKSIELTDKNWLMFKHIQAGRSVKEAYSLAGYKGTSIHAPYQLYKMIKKKIEAIWDADNADSLRLKMEAKKIVDMPLKESEIKAETKLKAIETLYKLSGQEKKETKSISPFIVFKASDKDSKADSIKIVEPIEAVDISKDESEEVENNGEE